MRFAWDTFLAPLVDTLKPKRLVEVGAYLGDGTRRILEYCRSTGGFLDVVDPLSREPDLRRQQQEVFDGLVRDNPELLKFHCARSLPLLDQFGPYDAIFIDGDHNWFVVMEELRAVERMALVHGTVPLIVLDDIGWPHGRRDSYFEPDVVPAEYRHPCRQGGIVPGQSALVEGGAPFNNFIHADHEGGPRNGVRTAVEDFLKETTLDLTCREIPLRSGTAVLVPRDRGPAEATTRNWLDAWTFGESQMPVLWQISAEHVAMVHTLGPMSRENRMLADELAKTRAPANTSS